MLKLIISSLIEVGKVSFSDVRISAVLDCFQNLLVQIIRHELKWLRVWNSSDLFDKLISILPLFLRLIQEKRLRLKVKDSLVVFVC